MPLNVNGSVEILDGIKKMLTISVEWINSDRQGDQEAGSDFHRGSLDEALEKVQQRSDVVEPSEGHCFLSAVFPKAMNVVTIQNCREIEQTRTKERRVEFSCIQAVGDVKASEPSQDELGHLFSL